jgi:hypothetical protein
VAAFALVALGAITAGCGGGSQSVAFDPVSAAATRTQHAGAARIRYSLAFNTPQLQGRMLRMRGTGVIDGTSVEASFKLGSELQDAGIPSRSSNKENLLKEDDNLVVFLRSGFLASRIPGGAHWIKLDLSKLGESAGIDLNQLMSGSGLQPTDLLSMLKTEGARVRKVGPANVDGVATTHFHVIVDMAKALDARGLSSPTLSAIAAEMPTVPEDVWIGKDGLVHRIKLAFGLQEQGKPVHMAMAMDLFDYGVHATIAAPPSSDVFDVTELARQGLGSAFNS